MVYINDRYRFIFIENPKSGSTSIIKAFEKTLNIKIKRDISFSHQNIYEIKQTFPDKWEKYTVISTIRNRFDRFCSAMNYEPHGQRTITPNGNLEFINELDTIEKLKAHIQNPGTCFWCMPQELFTEGCSIVLDINTNLQQQWNNVHHTLGFPGEPVVILNESKSIEKRFTCEELEPLYRLIYKED